MNANLGSFEVFVVEAFRARHILADLHHTRWQFLRAAKLKLRIGADLFFRLARCVLENNKNTIYNIHHILLYVKLKIADKRQNMQIMIIYFNVDIRECIRFVDNFFSGKIGEI